MSGAVARAVSGATLEAFPADMMHLLASDPLAPLSAVERVVLWRHREALVRIPASLPALLRAVQWRDNHAIAELHQLLARWPRELGPDALQLLGSRFADSKVGQGTCMLCCRCSFRLFYCAGAGIRGGVLGESASGGPWGIHAAANAGPACRTLPLS